MPKASEILARYRLTALALAVSAAVHAAVFVGLPQRIEAFDEPAAVVYSASLDPAGQTVATHPAGPPAPRRTARPKSRIAPPPEPLPPPVVVAEAAAPVETIPEPPLEPLKPEILALAQPAAPIPALEALSFPVEALPASVSIQYTLTSAFAEGRAVYNWSREGDNYTITSEAEAVGFFTLFLEGRIVQESRGTVSAEGLRPERFVERKPNTANEGLQFDWAARKVTFELGDKKKTEDLKDNTVDWLSMIFQMAHVPPAGESYALRVYTQRRRYEFDLKVLGVEEIEIPLGRVKALHLRHVDPKDNEVVDVWLGLDQYYLPVKLRYPVARNRLMVEQSATRVSSR